MGEPLKDKTYYVHPKYNKMMKDIRLSDGVNLEFVDRSIKLHKRKDIKSAVEWLKNEIDIRNTSNNKKNQFTGGEVKVLINRAFEEAIKTQKD